MFEFNTNEGYFLHLLKCALKTEQPLEAPDGIDFARIFEISQRHDVENLTFLSIDQLKNKPSDELYAQWQEIYYKDQKRTMFQDMALEELIETFTKAGIDCMPLKGSVIKNYYPNPDLRSMGDIDFLVREQNRTVVRDIMHSLGYEDDILDDKQVDGFKRQTLEYIEIHYDFSHEYHAYHKLFTIEWDKLVPTQTEHLYEMTFEDLYYFNVGHYAKNMHNKGMGLRGIVDTYVLWSKMTEEQKQNVLDRFEKTELKEFNNILIKISDIWFNDADDDGALNSVQDYLMDTKTYGSHKIGITLSAMYRWQSASNTEYIVHKIFPAAEELYQRFGIRHRCFLMIPFLWIARIFLQIFGSKKKWDKAKDQLDTFQKIDQDDIDYERKIRQEFGLV